MGGIFGEDGVEGGECFVEVAKDVFEGGLGAEDIMDEGLILLGLFGELNAILISFEALLEVMTLEKFGSLRMPKNVHHRVFESTHSSSNLNEIIIFHPPITRCPFPLTPTPPSTSYSSSNFSKSRFVEKIIRR